jgi:HK97 family phage portal protein
VNVFDTPLFQATMAALPEQKQGQFEDVLQRLIAQRDGFVNGVTPENCEQAPTVKAIITAITRRFAVTPIHVYQRGTKNGRETKERLPGHPVARLLSRPNSFQTRVDYWQDCASWLARYGAYYAFKSRGQTGPIRELLPMHPKDVEVKQDSQTWALTFRWGHGAEQQEYSSSRIHHIRGPARNGFSGDSPVKDVSLAIALEMAAEKFGASFFDNGALPLLIFTYMTASQGFKTKEEKDQFLQDIRDAFSGKRAHNTMLVPKGIDKPTTIEIQNDKSQFLETRKYQRTVIAGAWGVPPHLVGDLERATFNNVEQQDSDFTLNVIMPIGQAVEAAVERDLLTDEDRAGGVIVRFNFDSILRADFKSRQEGLRVQRDAGVISPNEWREIEGKNPISDDDGGEDYIRPSNFVVAGEEPVEPPAAKPKPNGALNGAEADAMKRLNDSMRNLKAIAEEMR